MNKLKVAAIALFIIALSGLIYSNWVSGDTCKGAQKRADDTFKILDTCQQLLGCTVTVNDLREAQEQLNMAARCK